MYRVFLNLDSNNNNKKGEVKMAYEPVRGSAKPTPGHIHPAIQEVGQTAPTSLWMRIM